MEVKLSAFNLLGWQNDYDFATSSRVEHTIIPGTRVCSRSNRKHLGVITSVGERVKAYPWGSDTRTAVETVGVYWQTGPHKGEHQNKLTEDLINYDAYKAYILSELSKLEANEIIANQTGM